jgi:hypothetical protein
MGRNPEYWSTFQSQRAAHRQDIFHPSGRLITAMCQQPMVSHADAKAPSDPPQHHRDHECLPAKKKSAAKAPM